MNFEVKFYKIPCAELIGPKGKRVFVPVNGPEHSDPQFGAKWDGFCDWITEVCV